MNDKKKLTVKEKFRSLLSQLIRLIFPPRCVVCNDLIPSGGELCCECLEIWNRARRAKCPLCQKTARGCTCRTFNLLDTDTVGDKRMSSLVFYGKFGSDDERDILVHRLVSAVKTSSDRSSITFCARELSGDLLKAILLSGDTADGWRITYPPRIRKRIRKFGFDHGRDLARKLSHYTGIPLQETLISRGRLTQKSLNALERRQNAGNSYHLKNDLEIAKKYIVVDDIITTGATVNTAANLLKKGGAEVVYPVCIARTKQKKRKLRRPSKNPWFRSK